MSEYGSCAVCGTDRSGDDYRWYPNIPICEPCAEFIANHYWAAHSGDWLTWPNNKPKTKAKARISAKIRAEVMIRDSIRCRHCGSADDLCMDHIVPESLGGETTVENLQVLCRSCNSRKGAAMGGA